MDVMDETGSTDGWIDLGVLDGQGPKDSQALDPF